MKYYLLKTDGSNEPIEGDFDHNELISIIENDKNNSCVVTESEFDQGLKVYSKEIGNWKYSWE